MASQFNILTNLNRYSVGLVAYFGVAIVSAAVEWGTFSLTLPIIGPIASAFAGFFVATLINFALSRRFVFRSKRPVYNELILVFLFSMAAFSVNFAVYIALFAQFGFNVFAAKVIGTGSGFIFNYGIRQFFIFSRRSPFAPLSTFVQDREHAKNPPLE
jgi:putative flippase GtrA